MSLPTHLNLTERVKEIDRRIATLANAEQKRQRFYAIHEIREVPIEELLPLLRMRLFDTKGRGAFKRIGSFLVELHSDEAIQLLLDFDRIVRRLVVTNFRLIASSNRAIATEYLKNQIQTGNSERKNAAFKVISETKRPDGVLILCNVIAAGNRQANYFLKKMGSADELTERVLGDKFASPAHMARILESMRVIRTRTLFRPFASFDPIQTLEKIVLSQANPELTQSARKTLEHLRAQQGLLRASSFTGGGESLLRPAGNTNSDENVLLRASEQKEEQVQSSNQ